MRPFLLEHWLRLQDMKIRDGPNIRPVEKNIRSDIKIEIIMKQNYDQNCHYVIILITKLGQKNKLLGQKFYFCTSVTFFALDAVFLS